MKELERSLGLVPVVAISISAMLGSGIFVLPGLAAAMSGPSVWLAYLISGICVLPAAISKAELSTAMPTSGGTYVFLDRTFGPLTGTIVGIALWLTTLLKSSFALLGFGVYLHVFAGGLPLVPTALATLCLIVALNLVGIRKVGQAQIVIVAFALVGLLLLVVFGSTTGSAANLQPALPHGVVGVATATAFVFVSYDGVTKVAAIAEEVKNPDRNLPIGILFSLVLVMVLYTCVALTLAANFPASELGADMKPIYSLANKIGGPAIGTAAAVLGVVTMTSMANAGLLAASRFPFAMSRDALLPSALAQVSERFRTPAISIVFTGLAMAVAISFLDVERLAKLASAIKLMIYITNNMAVIVFRESRVQWYQPAYRAPAYPWLQGAGILSGIGLLFMLGLSSVVALAMVAIPGLLLFMLYARRRIERRGVLGRLGRREDLLLGEPVPEVSDTLRGDAAVVVALMGKERSPEMLVDVGAALATDRKLQVIHLTEVPEQTSLDALTEEEAFVQSLRRRVGALGEEKHLDLEFHPLLSRDLVRTVHGVTSRFHCEWLVMAWHGRARDALLPYNPLGWLINHLESNLAIFRDQGVRYVRKIIAMPDPGPNDALVVGTADHLADQWGAEMTLVRIVPSKAHEQAEKAALGYLSQLADLCHTSPARLVLRSDNPVQTMADLTAAHDLLVMGARDLRLVDLVRGNVEERIKSKAACSVLTVRSPRRQTHEALQRVRRSEPGGGFRLSEFVDSDAVGACLELTRKEALFNYLGQSFERALGGPTAREITEALWDRERTQNTAVGEGVALPHAILPGIDRLLVGIFTMAEELDYQAPDRKGIDVAFVIIGPASARNTHLMLLSGVARLALTTELLPRLREAKTPDEIMAVVRRCERISNPPVEPVA